MKKLLILSLIILGSFLNLKAQAPQVDIKPVILDKTVYLTTDITIPNAQILTYIWDFGDGTPGSSSVEDIHTYSEYGEYKVTLMVQYSTGTGSNAGDDPQSYNVVEWVNLVDESIIPDEYQPEPNISIDYAIDDHLVYFTACVSGPDMISSEYLWYFGDGNTSTEKNPNHSYSDSKEYLVNLEVSYTTANNPVTEVITESEEVNIVDDSNPSLNGPYGIKLEPYNEIYSDRWMMYYTWDTPIVNDVFGDQVYLYLFINGIEISMAPLPANDVPLAMSADPGVYTVQICARNSSSVVEWSNAVTCIVKEPGSQLSCAPSECAKAEFYPEGMNILQGTNATFDLYISPLNSNNCFSFEYNRNRPWNHSFNATRTGNSQPESLEPTDDSSFPNNLPEHISVEINTSGLATGEYTVSDLMLPLGANCENNAIEAITTINVKPALLLKRNDTEIQGVNFKVGGEEELTIKIEGPTECNGTILVYGDWIKIEKFESDELIISCTASGKEAREGRIVVTFPETYESKTLSIHQAPSLYEVYDSKSLANAVLDAEDGSTILFSEGIYNEPISILGKSITLASKFHTTGDPYYIDHTIIDVEGQSNVIKVIGNEYLTGSTEIIGMHITGGNADNGAGIYCSNSNLNLSHVLIHGNTAHTGGGIYSNNSIITGNHITITKNNADYTGESFNPKRGKAIYISNNSNITLSNSIIGCSSGESSSGNVYFDLNTPESYFGVGHTHLDGVHPTPVVSVGVINSTSSTFRYGMLPNYHEVYDPYEKSADDIFWIKSDSPCTRAGSDYKDMGALYPLGKCINCPTFSVDPESLAFDNVILGNAAHTKIIEVSHTVTSSTERYLATTVVPEIALNSDDFRVVPKELTLFPGETKNIYVTFSPQSYGYKMGRLDLKTRSTTYVVEIELSGKCVTKQDLSHAILERDYEIKSGRFVNAIFHQVINIGGTTSEKTKVKYYLSVTPYLVNNYVYLGELEILPLEPGLNKRTPENLITIPQETGTGDYYFIAVVDPDNELDEHNEENNIIKKKIRVTYARPAFTIDNIRLLDPKYNFTSISEPGYLPGNPGKVSYRLNSSSDDALEYNLKIYLSKNATYESSDIELVSISNWLSANQSTSLMSDFILPEDTEPGQYSLLFRAYEISIPEDNPRISTAYKGFQALRNPDYEIWAYEYLLPVHSGEEINVNLSIRNNTNSAAPATEIKYYFSLDLNYDESDIELATASVPEFTLYEPFHIIKQSIVIPEGIVGDTWYLLVHADPDNLIEEDDESNNWNYTQFQVEPYADLITNPIELNVNSVTAGSSVFASCMVKNIGYGNAQASKLKFYLSVNNLVENNVGDIILGEVMVDALAYNEEFNINSLELNIPFDVGGGDWQIIARADDEQVNPTHWDWSDVHESDENNNTSYTQLSVTRQPELFIRTSSRLVNGQATIHTIREDSEIIWFYQIMHSNGEMQVNNGNPEGLSFAAQNTLRCYLSTDDILDTNNDLLLNTHTIESTYGNEYLSGELPLTIPDDMIAATYHIFAVIDADNVVDERIEDNNIWHQELTITNKPDLVLLNIQVEPQVIVQNVSESFTINGLVKNVNPENRVNSAKIELYLSNDTDLDPEDHHLYDINQILSEDVLNEGEFYRSFHNEVMTWAVAQTHGNYYVICKTSIANNIEERDESNNIAVVPFEIQQPVDLEISALSLDHTTIEEGTDFTVSCTIRNNNATTSQATSLNFNLDISQNSNSFLKLDLETIQINSLAQGEELTINRTYNVPYESRASFFNAIIDAENTNLEFDEENNKISTGIVVTATPDLEVGMVNIPETIEIDESLNINFEVYNQSYSDAGEFIVKYYLLQNTQYDPTDLYLGEEIVNNLQGLESVSINNSDIYIPETANIGGNYLLVVANPDNLLNERNTDNNTSSKIISVINSRPALTISEPTLSVSSARSGDIINVSCIIKNEGNGDAGAFKLNQYLSTSTYYNSIPTYTFNDVNINSLAAGEEILINQEITIPVISRANIYFSFFVDRDNVINEKDEDNNAAFIPLIISEDYYISSTITDASCNGCSDGEISITLHGGKEPYTYEWQKDASIISTNKDLINLTAGNYQVFVSDANNETIIQSFSILQPNLSIVNSTITNVSSYGGSDGAIDLQLNGSPPYTFMWSNGATSEDVSSLTSGYYSVNIMDTETSVYQGFFVTEPINIEINLTNVSSYNESDGEIICAVNGGYGSKTFVWYKDGEEYSTDQNLSNILAGEYSLVVTDARGDFATTDVSISQPNWLIADGNITNVSVYGANDGAIDLNITNGNPPYTFYWSDGSTTENINSLSFGNYYVDISDAYQTITKFFTIYQPIDPNASIANVTRYNGSDGYISCSAQGGIYPYTYVWFKDGVEYVTSYKLENISAGQYEVHVTDAAGHITNRLYEITQPNQLEATFNGIAVSTYNGNDGSIEINIQNGNPPYEIILSNKSFYLSETWAIDKTSGEISGLIPAQYCVTVQEENSPMNGNRLVDFITVGNQIGILYTVDHVTQYGGSNGGIVSNVQGGDEPYLYSWYKEGIEYSTEENLTGLSSGVYTLTTTDNLGRIGSTEIVVNEPNELIIDAIVTDVSNVGGNDGAVDLTVSSGNPPYTFDWYQNPAGYTSVEEDANGLSTGVYYIRVTDNAKQVANLTTVVHEPLDIFFSVTHLRTHGATTGQILCVPQTGQYPYTYEWTLNETSFSNSQHLYNLVAGDYKVTIKDRWGVTATETVIITEPDVWEIEYNVTDVSTFDGNDGAIDITVLGGNPPFTYTWYNTESNSEDVEGLVAGDNYSVLVKDKYNQQLYKWNIEVTNPLTITYLDKNNNTSVSGNSGYIGIRCEGGYQPLNMVWYKDGLEYSSHPNTNSGTISNLSSGEYTVTFIDQNDDIIVETYHITDPVIVEMTTTNVSAHEANDGDATLEISGGLLPYSFEWEKDGIIYSSEKNLSNLSHGIYTVTVTGSEGRYVSATKEISQFLPSVVLSGGGEICGDGSLATIGITFTGVAPWTVELQNGANTIVLDNITTSYYEYTTDILGTYQIISGSDNFNNFGSYSGTAVVELLDSPNAIMSGDGSICRDGSNATLNIDLTGEAPWDVSYTDGTLIYNLMGITESHHEVTVLIPSTYIISSVTDANCIGTFSGTAEIISVEVPVAIVTGGKGICDNAGTASVNIELQGTAPWSLTYTDGTNSFDVNDISETNYEILTNVTGSYSVTEISNASGCPGYVINTVEVYSNPLPTATVNGNTTICENETTDVSIGLTGTAPWNINYTDGTTSFEITSWTNNYNLPTSTAGTYSVTSISDANCTGADFGASTEIIVNPLPNLDLGIDRIITEGETTTLDAGSGFTYLWEPDLSTNQTLNVSEVGEYSVTITDQNNCTNSDNISVSVFSLGPDVSLCEGASLQLDAGDGFESYLWSDGTTERFLTVSTGGIYSVEVTNSHGYSKSDMIEVTEHLKPLVDLGPDMFINIGQSVTLDPGTGYSYFWNDGSTEQQKIVSEAGTYSVIVSNEHGCIAFDDIVITIETLLPPYLGPDVSFCEGGNITLDAGLGYQSYQWNGQEGGNTLEVNTSGTYIIEAGTDSGQILSDTILITVFSNPVVNLGSDLVVQPDTFIYIAAEPGYISYEWPCNNNCRVLCVSTQNLTEPVDIWVNVTDENGCVGTDNIQLSLEDPIATNTAKSNQTDTIFVIPDLVGQKEEIYEPASYNIYPNPTNGKFFISVSDPVKVKEIDLYDILGNLIKSFRNIKKYPFEVDLSNQSYGIYLIKVREQNNTREFKVFYNK